MNLDYAYKNNGCEDNIENRRGKMADKIALPLVLLLLLTAIIVLIFYYSIYRDIYSINHSYNVYTVGKAKIEITLDDNNANIADLEAQLINNYHVGIKNTGTRDVYVFISIIVPYEDVRLGEWQRMGRNQRYVVYDDFTSKTQMISFQANYRNSVSDEWKLVDVGYVGDKEIYNIGGIHNTTEDYFVISGDKLVYVYGYVGDNTDGSLKALAPGYETESPFDFLDIPLFFNKEDWSAEFTTNAYAIQTTKIKNGSTDVNYVWDIINKSITNDN